MPAFLTLRLQSLDQHTVRLGWFARWIGEIETIVAARELEALLDDVESFDTRATPALVTAISWVSGAVAPPALHAIARTCVTEQRFRSKRFLAHASDCPAEPTKNEAGRTPDYAGQRPLTLGERKNQARRHGRSHIERLIRDPHPAVIEQLLSNPQLTEPDLLRLVTLRPPHPPSLCHLFRDGRWLTSTRIRMGLLLNPGLPLWQSTPLLWLCNRQELCQLASAKHVPNALQCAAQTNLGRHPPLRASTTSLTIH